MYTAVTLPAQTSHATTAYNSTQSHRLPLDIWLPVTNTKAPTFSSAKKDPISGLQIVYSYQKGAGSYLFIMPINSIFAFIGSLFAHIVIVSTKRYATVIGTQCMKADRGNASLGHLLISVTTISSCDHFLLVILHNPYQFRYFWLKVGRSRRFTLLHTWSYIFILQVCSLAIR